MPGLLLAGSSQGAEHKREGCGQLILGGEGAAELLGQRRDDLAGVLRRDVVGGFVVLDGDQEIGVQITSGAQADAAVVGAVPAQRATGVDAAGAVGRAVRLRAEGGGFIPLKIGINNDISAFLAEHPEAELTMDEWLCAVSCITSRRVYLQRTAVAGVPRYGLDGHPKGQVSESEAQSAGRRLATLEQKWLRMQTQQENISE